MLKKPEKEPLKEESEEKDDDKDLHEGVMGEFMDAVHKKDHKSALESLKALIMSCKGDDK